MSKATFTFGRFNPPTEVGHGKLVSAVQSHAEKSGGSHYIFPSHSQDAKKNPLSHADKVHAMSRLFPNANVVSQGKVRTAIDAMKHLEKKGHTHVTMVVGSDRVAEFHGLLSKYRKKEFPGIKKVNVVSAGNRDPDAEGAEGMSASKLRGLVSAGKKDEFVSHYSDKKLGAHIHDKVKAGLQMESTNPVGIFLLGGPGSGKDYVLKNIFSRFDLTEVQADQILNGVATELYESKQNIVINGVNDPEKISVIQSMLEGYVFDFVHVTVSNKVSRLRNEQREQPIDESKRIDKFLKAEKLAQQTEAYIFNNSINLNESSEFERVFFASQIEKLLERIVDLGLPMLEEAEPKTFMHLREKKFPPVAKDKESGLPKKYVRGLSASTAKARKAHWKKMGKLSDKDPRAYEPAPGDATAKTKPSKHTIAVRKMMDEQVEGELKKPHTVENIAKKHDVTVDEISKALERGIKVEMEHTKDKETAETIALAHLWEKPDYYKLLAKMEQAEPMTAADHIDAEKKIQRERDRRDWRVLHHQNRHIHQAAMGEATEDLPPKLRRAPRSGNITQVMDKRQETGRVDESDSSLSAKAAKSGISVGTLRKVYKRGVAAWNSGHRPGTTPQQWGHARVNSYINKGKTYHTADKDLREELENIDELFEMQLVGTDEYRKHAIAMTPGQGEIENAYSTKATTETKKSVSEHCGCETDTNAEVGNGNGESVPRRFRDLRTEAKKEKEVSGDSTVNFEPVFDPQKKKPKNTQITPPTNMDSVLQGLPVTSRFNAYEETEQKLSTLENLAELAPTLEEAVSYHLENKISFTENVFRPGSEMFFDMISEAKRLYAEGKYTPADEWEKDMLETDIGEIAEYEGQQVVLDYPIEEGLEECWKGYTQRGMKKKGDKMVPNCVPMNEEGKSDPTDGKGIGKPFRQGGGGAVYVRSGDGVRKITFSNSGMAKKYNDPARVRSFVARHHCLTNKDKTSRSYWACRWPRYFSNSGQTWW
jgi:dephospho-CoA kinase